MANRNVLLLLVVVAVVLFLYYVCGKQLTGGCMWCPSCNSNDGNCPSCPTSHKDALQVLQQMARGCTHRLRGVVRENMATLSDVREFMTGGSNRLTVVTNIDPEAFVELVASGQDLAMQQIKAVAMSSAVVKGQKTYMVMSVTDGKLGPIGSPTPQFASAFDYLEATARKEVGPDVNNLVFYIDEDIPCPLPHKEKCCGRRH